MQGPDLQAAIARLRAFESGLITGATLRRGLVLDGLRFPATLAARDRSLRLEMRIAPGRPLGEITFQSHPSQPVEAYDSTVKAAWESLQDIADSKFSRKTKKGTFPRLSEIRQPGKLLVTDTWEIEGVRIEAGVIGTPFYGAPTMQYAAALRVTDLSDLPAMK
jgi:hypothetical protein